MTLKVRKARKAWPPAARAAYGSALLPKKGKFRDESLCPSASCVSIITATPIVALDDGQPFCG
eukprot:1833405-Prymnesium_polylepis.1